MKKRKTHAQLREEGKRATLTRLAREYVEHEADGFMIGLDIYSAICRAYGEDAADEAMREARAQLDEGK